MTTLIKLNEINCMDCFEGLKNIPNESVDCIITDPPYGINYHSNRYKGKNPHKKIIGDDKLSVPVNEFWRILKPTGCIFIFHSHKVPLEDKRKKNTIIWVKNNHTAGNLKGDFGNQYESIAFIPKEEFKLKSKRYSNVWYFDKVPPNKLLHPSEKPIEIIKRMVECSTNEGALILDPFIGSGTTAVVCKQLNRNFIGFEIDQEYVDIANKRVYSETKVGMIEYNKETKQNLRPDTKAADIFMESSSNIVTITNGGENI